MVFQKPNPFPSMTIGENVLAGLKLAQISQIATRMNFLKSV
jgi:ABC-type phosphate transport system ATPase subunit